MRALLALIVLTGLIAGCSIGDDSGDGTRSAKSSTATVEVVPQQPPAGEDGQPVFDAQALYDREAPGVVTIYSLFGTGTLDSILRGGGGGGGGVGSGFVINGEGEIATNAHVVTQGEGASIKRARAVYVEFADGNRVEAKVAGHDPFSDVALLRVDPGGLRLRPLELGTNASIDVGEPVAAIGSPFGERQSLSVGVVSATGRSIKSLTRFQISDAIQTDAAINPGNSGGPLVDFAGRVIGVNQQIQTQSGANEGVGYAVPIDLVKRAIDQLDKTGKVRYAYLGVSTQETYPQLADRYDLPVAKGAWIQEIVQGGPADKAGLRGGGRGEIFQAQRVNPGGDIVVRIDGAEIADPDDLSRVVNLKAPGDRIKIEYYRGKDRRTTTVTLGERPLQDPASAP